MEFYKVLQSLMDERGMTIPDLARVSGLSDSTIRSIVTRKSKSVALEVAVKVSRGLGVSLEYLNDGLSSAVPADLISPREYSIIKKYRTLDERGKSAVLAVLDHEYETAGGGKADPLSHGA